MEVKDGLKPELMERVICVDDDPICLMLEDMVLKQSKIAKQTICVGSGSEAIDLLNKIHGEDRDLGLGEKKSILMLLDINMPEMTGWQFLEALEEKYPHLLENLRVVILSSSIDDADINKSRQFKAVSKYLSKPLTPDSARSCV